MAFEKLIWHLDTGEAERWFAYAGYKARNLRDPLVKAGSRLLHHINLTFQSEGAHALEHWPELNAGYAKQKMAEWGARPLLVASGAMRSKAISRSTLRYHPEGLTYELTSPWFAELHQDGGDITYNKRLGTATAKPPRRRFVAVIPALTEQIEDVFVEWLDDLRAMNRRRSGPALNPLLGG